MLDLKTIPKFVRVFQFHQFHVLQIWIPEIGMDNIVEKTADSGLSGGNDLIVIDGCSGTNTLQGDAGGQAQTLDSGPM